MHVLCKFYLLQITGKFHQITFTLNFQISKEKNAVQPPRAIDSKGILASKILGPYANCCTVTLCGLELC